MWLDVRAEEQAQRTYTAELLWSMARNDFTHYGGGSDFRFPRYSDIFVEKRKAEDSRSGEEIVNGVLDRLRQIAERENKNDTV